MQNPESVLARMEEFLAGLQEYYEIYDSQEEYDRAQELCGRLRGLYGRLGAAFTELGVTREYEVMGNRNPVFETALSPYDPVTGAVVGQALDIAKAAVEIGIGTLQNRIERGVAENSPPAPPPAPQIIKVRRRSFWYVWFLVGLVLGWLGGRNETLLLALFRSDAGLLYGKIVGVGLLAIGFTVFGGLFTNLVHEFGWRRAAREYRGRFYTYLGLMVICGISAAIATASKPEPPKPPDAVAPGSPPR